MMDRLLVQRNANMVERMRVRLKEGNAFVAVGALHLPERPVCSGCLAPPATA